MVSDNSIFDKEKPTFVYDFSDMNIWCKHRYDILIGDCWAVAAQMQVSIANILVASVGSSR